MRAERADVGFFAIDPVRSEGIRFTAPYVLIEGAYLVRNGSPLSDNGEVDRAGMRIMVGKGSAYDLYLTRDAEGGQAGARADLAARSSTSSWPSAPTSPPASSSSSRPTRRGSAACACCPAASW